MNLELRIKENKKILFFCFFVFLFYGVNAVMADVKCICSAPGMPNWESFASTNCSENSQPAMSITCVSATGLVPTPTGGGGEGDYTLNDFVTVFINLAAWILGITGSLALLFFIYGGVMFLISGGSSERVQQAKQIIIGSIIGVVIVLTSYMIINFVLTSLGYNITTFGEWSKIK